MLKNLISRLRFGKIVDQIEDTLFFDANDYPPIATVRRWILDLSCSDNIIFPSCYVDRSEDHVIAWISAFLETEKKSLDVRFSPENGRGYKILIFTTSYKSKLIIRTMLSTIGYDGHTSYDVSIQKYFDGDEVGYVCVE